MIHKPNLSRMIERYVPKDIMSQSVIELEVGRHPAARVAKYQWYGEDAYVRSGFNTDRSWH
jgi:hypothetical protein